jgi:hypothetical protein
MKPPQSAVRLLYVELAPEHIAAVKFVFEAYEEVAIVRTLDRHKAVIVLLIAPDFYGVARAILESLREDFPCGEVLEPAMEIDDWLMQQIAADADMEQ